jgi:DNA-binding LacI/PurR family transcriptional regulator
MAVTIRDIAQAAGVSHSTVSRALQGSPLVASETGQHIRQLANELGYVPNTVARGLKTNRSGVLGVIVRRIMDPYFSEVLQGIEDVLQAEGYSLFLAASNRDPKREEAIVRVMSEQRVDGVIICSTQVGEEHRRQLERFGVLSVLVNNQASEEIGRSIYHDDVDGSRQLTRHLIELGHRRIGFMGNVRAGRTSDDRLQGFRETMRAANLEIPPDYVVMGANGLPEGGFTVARRFLSLRQRPSAIVCYNDLMAIGAIQALQSAGVCVPEDCSITGFDNIELAAYVTPPLTTFDQPKYKIGQTAAKMMLRLLEDNELKEANILTLRGELCLRASTGPPAR